MNQQKRETLLAFKAMLYTAREEGFSIPEKYEQLEQYYDEIEEVDVTDMYDNMDNFYEQLNTNDFKEWRKENE